MKIIAADDEKIALMTLVEAINEAYPKADVKAFRKSSEVIEYVENNKADVAFLDIDMRGANGIELAKKLKECQPKINIIFVTGYSEYMGEAFSLHASGYVLKPPTREKIEAEIDNLRHPIEEKSVHVKVQTFGNFEVFVDGKPLVMKLSKSKELLAYLVDRKGAGVSTAEIASVLWEDKEYTRSLKNQVQTVVHKLFEALEDVQAQDILIKKWNSLSLNVEKVTCDYYEFLKGDINYINLFMGEYMTNYSWAEFTTGYLCEHS
ncbi:MAG: response regulator [Clostridium butyricum]|nr:response regulator [Clostridium butyricum]